MAQLLKHNVIRKELEEGIIPQNMVLCKVYYQSEGAKTRSGIIYGINTDTIYGSSDKTTVESHAADMGEVSMIVYKLPERLYFNPDDRDKSMAWETEMELCEDDVVWTNVIDSLNAVTLVCEGELYKLINYQDIICAKRGEQIVMLNGYALCEQVMLESKSEFDVISADKVDPRKGKIAFTGEPNKRYLNDKYKDIQDIHEGDIVLFDKKYSPILLERKLYASKFSSEKLYIVVQRRKIACVVK